jgi:hypothetical protein
VVISAKVRGNLTAMLWKDNRDNDILTNMQRPPREGILCDKQRKIQKPVIVTDYNQYMDYTDKGERLANSYSFTWRT